MRVLFYFIPIVTLTISTLGVAEPNLTAQESEEYAKACFKVVKNKYYCDSESSIYDEVILGKPEKTYYDDTYSYWPSKVLAVDSRGAVIQAKVRVSYSCMVGDNKGWGEAVSKKDEYTFTCLSKNVAKGAYPPPVVFLRDTGGKGFDVWAYREETPTSSNIFLDEKSTQKGYVPIKQATKDRYDVYWTVSYWGLELAKKYFSEHL